MLCLYEKIVNYSVYVVHNDVADFQRVTDLMLESVSTATIPFAANAASQSEKENGPEMRAKIAAGETLFNTAVATITDVRGLNDNPALGSPVVIKGTCTTCHDTPNVGNHSMPLPLDIATSRLVAFESNPAIVAGLRS